MSCDMQFQKINNEKRIQRLFNPITEMETEDLQDIYDHLQKKIGDIEVELAKAKAQRNIISEDLMGRADWLPF